MSDELAQRAFVLRNRRGMHARPSGMIVRELMQHQSQVTLSANGVVADGRSIMDLLMLGAQLGDEVQVTARGPDAETCVAAILALAETGFGERD